MSKLTEAVSRINRPKTTSYSRQLICLVVDFCRGYAYACCNTPDTVNHKSRCKMDKIEEQDEQDEQDVEDEQDEQEEQEICKICNKMHEVMK